MTSRLDEDDDQVELAVRGRSNQNNEEDQEVFSDGGDSESEESESEEDGAVLSWYKQAFGSLCNANVIVVSAVILADGSEEIAVFLPLLTASNHMGRPVFGTSLTWTTWQIVFLFYALITLQCMLAFGLVHFSRNSFCNCIDNGAVDVIARYSKNILPFILMGLGVYILSDSVLFVH